MQPGSGNFGTAISSFLREPDLALEEARSDLRCCKIPIPERTYSCPHRGGHPRFRCGSKGTNPLTREYDVWHHRKQHQAPEGSHFRFQRLPIQVPRMPIQVARAPHSGVKAPIQVPRVPIQVPRVPILAPRVPIQVPRVPIQVPTQVPRVPIQVPRVPRVAILAPLVPIQVPKGAHPGTHSVATGAHSGAKGAHSGATSAHAGAAGAKGAHSVSRRFRTTPNETNFQVLEDTRSTEVVDPCSKGDPNLNPEVSILAPEENIFWNPSSRSLIPGPERVSRVVKGGERFGTGGSPFSGLEGLASNSRMVQHQTP
jgi:hypothetical protein